MLGQSCETSHAYSESNPILPAEQGKFPWLVGKEYGFSSIKSHCENPTRQIYYLQVEYIDDANLGFVIFSFVQYPAI